MIQWPKQRAWGWYATLIRTPWFCVKLLRFKSGGELSMQRHKYRTEIWLFLWGEGWRDPVVDVLNSYAGPFYIWKIYKNTWHKFRAMLVPVYAIELQYGRKVTESDIERK